MQKKRMPENRRSNLCLLSYFEIRHTLRLSLKRLSWSDCIKDDGPIRIRLKSNAVEESRVGIALT